MLPARKLRSISLLNRGKRRVETAKWYVAEGDEAIGPLSARDVLDRIEAAGERPTPVWTEGMAQWADASTIPEFSKAPGGENAALRKSVQIGARLRHELIEFTIIALYLYVAFGALIAFKFTILKGEGVSWAPWGIAIVKALILGKFILLLQAAKLGESGDVVVLRIVRKAALFVLALFLLNALEEYLIGHLHGKTNVEIIADMTGLLSGPFVISFLMFMILVPYFTYRELNEGLGHDQLRRLFTARRGSEAAVDPNRD